MFWTVPLMEANGIVKWGGYMEELLRGYVCYCYLREECRLKGIMYRTSGCYLYKV